MLIHNIILLCLSLALNFLTPISCHVYIYIYIYTHKYAYTCIYIYIYMYIHVSIYIYIYVYMHVYMYVCIYIYIYIYIHTHTYYKALKRCHATLEVKLGFGTQTPPSVPTNSRSTNKPRKSASLDFWAS